MPRLSKIGAAALAAFGWTGLQSVTATYLVVAGGGGASGSSAGGGAGGGAGGFRDIAAAQLSGVMAVTVGQGGIAFPTGLTSDAASGQNSKFGSFQTKPGGFLLVGGALIGAKSSSSLFAVEPS